MEFHVDLMMFNGISWDFMVFNGISWDFMVFNGISSDLMVFNMNISIKDYRYSFWIGILWHIEKILDC